MILVANDEMQSCNTHEKSRVCSFPFMGPGRQFQVRISQWRRLRPVLTEMCGEIRRFILIADTSLIYISGDWGK